MRRAVVVRREAKQVGDAREDGREQRLACCVGKGRVVLHLLHHLAERQQPAHLLREADGGRGGQQWKAQGYGVVISER